jgi:ribosomal protein S18 acetylase RimI-like enzyme
MSASLDAIWLRAGDERGKRALWTILCAVDREYLPPLSTRETIASRALDFQASPGEPHAYFEEMLRQENVLVTIDSEYAGFMSVKPGHVDDAIAEVCPCSYVTTIGVFPAFRRFGVARRLYRAVLEETPPKIASRFFVTRTWSTNDAHVRLLGALGFREVKRLRDHRGAGIDSIYFTRYGKASGAR